MKKICHFVNNLQFGGVLSVIINYSKLLDKKYDIHIAYLGIPEKKIEEKLLQLGFTLHQLTERKKNIIKNIIDVKKLIKNGNFDIAL